MLKLAVWNKKDAVLIVCISILDFTRLLGIENEQQVHEVL